MYNQSEFAKILETKLKNSSQAERKASNSNSAKSSNNNSNNSSTETKQPKEPWMDLLGNVGARTFSREFQSTLYRKFQTPPKPRPANKLSQDQLTAFLFFAAHGVKMEANFSIKDLKKAFRTLAMKMHPDHGGNTQTFLELKAAYDLLAAVFKKA